MAEVRALQQNSEDPQGVPRDNCLNLEGPGGDFLTPPDPWEEKLNPWGPRRSKSTPGPPRKESQKIALNFPLRPGHPPGECEGRSPSQKLGGVPPSKESYSKD